MRFHVSANRYQLDAGQQRPASASIEQIDKQPRGIGMPRLRRDHQSVDLCNSGIKNIPVYWRLEFIFVALNNRNARHEQ